MTTAAEVLALPMGERVRASYALFDAGDVETIMELLAPDVTLTVHGIRGGSLEASGREGLLAALGEVAAQLPAVSAPVEVAESPDRVFVVVDVEAAGRRFQEIHCFRNDEDGRVTELVIVPVDATITQGLWP